MVNGCLQFNRLAFSKDAIKETAAKKLILERDWRGDWQDFRAKRLARRYENRAFVRLFGWGLSVLATPQAYNDGPAASFPQNRIWELRDGKGVRIFLDGLIVL